MGEGEGMTRERERKRRKSGWVVAVPPSSEKQLKPIETTGAFSNPDLPPESARALALLQDAYNILHKKHKQLKTKQFADVERAFDEQSERIADFSAAADALVEDFRRKDQLKEIAIQKLVSRLKLVEDAYIGCQNDLVIERSKNLELQQELGNPRVQRSTLMHELLEHLTQFSVSDDGESQFTFCHNESGFVFRLEKNKLSEKVGGKDALLYRMIAPGTLTLFAAQEWIHSEIVFDKVQVCTFFQQLQAVVFSRG